MACTGPPAQETVVDWEENDSEPDEEQEDRIKALAGEAWNKAAQQNPRLRHAA
ncbi:hypothetical protein FS749_014632 [Ceratobasidium sp. UAMH 11750]|nr:hypothetical protein FS749_014632 [Ceratobasidium sp. UAMH 11750]